MNVPAQVFLTRGVGRHKDKLTSFELALRRASIARFNLVKVSSIYPPGCRVIPKTKGVEMLHSGQIVFCVMSQNETNEPNRLVAASVGLAIPADKDQYGYLSEHHSFGETDEKAGDYAEDMAAEMLATILGIEFDADHSYDEMAEVWRMSVKIVRTSHVAQSAVGSKEGLWTTVLAAAVFAA